MKIIPEPANSAASAPDHTEQLREALIGTYFRHWDDAELRSDAGQQAMDDHLRARYEEACLHFVPWIAGRAALDGTEVVEIGSGTGSITAALAPHVRRITGYDMQQHSIDAAARRMEILQLDNYTFVKNEPALLEEALRQRHPAGIDVVILYAVLEHQTLEERLSTLRTCWELLTDGGLLVVCDTPNRLTFLDLHTSHLPFYNMLPDDLAVEVAASSPRREFRDSMAEARAESTSRALEVLTRWGRGVSHHDFEVALGLRDLPVIGDGFDPEILAWKPLEFDETLLAAYLATVAPQLSLGFGRRSLDLIIQKGSTPGQTGSRTASGYRSRLESVPGLLHRHLHGEPLQAVGGAELDEEDLVRLARDRLAGRTLGRLALGKIRGRARALVNRLLGS